jgi:hypothetical protein
MAPRAVWRGLHRVARTIQGVDAIPVPAAFNADVLGMLVLCLVAVPLLPIHDDADYDVTLDQVSEERHSLGQFEFIVVPGAFKGLAGNRKNTRIVFSGPLEIELWGADFTFDEDGVVFYQGSSVGSVTVNSLP